MENEEIVETPAQENQEETKEKEIEETTTEDSSVSEKVKEEPKRETLKLPEKEDDSIEIEGVKYPKDLIEKAKRAGWRDKSFLEETGKDNKYLDPKTFVERGDEAIPFLHKRIDGWRKENGEIRKENSSLKEMLKKQISDSVKDRMEGVEKQLKDAKEYGEYDNVEKLIEKKLQLKEDLDNYSKEEIIQQPQIQNKPPEMTSWELKNDWSIRSFDGEDNPNFDESRAIKANDLFIKIGQMSPSLDLNARLKIVDDNLADLDNKSRQRANVTPPIQSTSTSAITPNNSKTFENLTSASRRIFDEACVGIDGKPFTGKAMEIAKASFLERCEDKYFKK